MSFEGTCSDKQAQVSTQAFQGIGHYGHLPFGKILMIPLFRPVTLQKRGSPTSWPVPLREMLFSYWC